MNTEIPVVLICYNRPHHTARVLQALEINGVNNLYIFSDGSKTPEDADTVKQTRSLLKKIDWTKPTIINRETNLGLAESILSAVDHVLEIHDRFILLEDDLIPKDHFFSYMTDCLSRYESVKSVFGVHGYSVPIPESILIKYPHDIYFHPRAGSWAWGTWKDRWQYFRRDIAKAYNQALKNGIDLTIGGHDIPGILNKTIDGSFNNSWAIYWLLSVYLKGGVYIYPTKSHIENIGFDGTGVNCFKTDKYKTVYADKKPEAFPARIYFNTDIVNYLNSYFRGPHVTEDALKQYISKGGAKQNHDVCTPHTWSDSKKHKIGGTRDNHSMGIHTMTDQSAKQDQSAVPRHEINKIGWGEYAKEWNHNKAELQIPGLLPHDHKEVSLLGDEWNVMSKTIKFPYGIDRFPNNSFQQYIDDNLITKYLPEGDNLHVMEIGPGGGRITKLLLKRCSKIYAVDISEEMLLHLKNNFNDTPILSCILSDGKNIPGIAANTLDCIISFDAFVHMEPFEIFNYLEKSKKLLKSGGIGIVHFSDIETSIGFKQFKNEVSSKLNNGTYFYHFSSMCKTIMGTFLQNLGYDIITITNDVIPRDAVAVFRKPAQSSAKTASIQIPDTIKTSNIAQEPSIQNEEVDDLIAQGLSYLQSGEYSRAFNQFCRVKSLRKPVRNIDFYRAKCLLSMQRHLEAREALREEIRYFPNNQKARDLIEQIQKQYPLQSSTDIDDPEFKKLYATINNYTMVGVKRLYSLFKLAKKICADDIPGNFVECGVAAGGSAALLAYVIKNYSKRDRTLFAFDSFEGMPTPTEKDCHQGINAELSGWGTGTCSAPEASVHDICAKLHVLDLVKTIKGYFQDTLPAMKNTLGDIAFLHMDGDWYESTKAILDNIYNIIVDDGLIQVDDYGHWDGCRKAIHAFEQNSKLNFALNKIDYSGVWFRKQQNRIIKHTIKPRTKFVTTANQNAIKVINLCATDRGGAGTAAFRLNKGLQSIGVDSTMYVLSKKSADNSVKLLPCSLPMLSEKKSSGNDARWNLLWNSWQSVIAGYPGRPKGLDLFTDTRGWVDLQLIDDIQAADIINFHWVAGIFDCTIKSAMLSAKHIVWTLHDMNAFTGGCHYAGECKRYLVSCGACPQLGSQDTNDISRQHWQQKHAAYNDLNLTIVTPSRWLAACAEKSPLLSRFATHVIPNGFPLDIFKPHNKEQSRQNLNIPRNARIVLFGADSVKNRRKGFNYAVEALNILSAGHPEENIIFMCFGKPADCSQIKLQFPFIQLGPIQDDKNLAEIYSAADVYVLPSLEDNLPNTVIESIACGTPVVGFDIGGMPDMIEHKITGYLVKPGNSDHLAEGIKWILTATDHGSDLSHNCRKKAQAEYALDIQAQAYKRLYENTLNTRHARHAASSSHAALAKSTITEDRHIFDLNRRGEQLYAHGDVHGALKAFNSALSIQQDHARTHNNLGVLYWHKGNIARARKHLLKALELNPDEKETIVNCGEMYKATNQIKSAQSLYNNYLQNHPDDYEINNLLHQISKSA